MGCFQPQPKECSYKVHLLDDTEVVLLTSPRRRGRDLLDQVFSHLNLVEIEYFGLRYHDAAENLTPWLDEEKPLYKQVGTGKGHDGCSTTSSSVSLFFAVRFYVSDPAKLLEEVTRYQFYRQLRRDVAQGRIAVSRELAAQLGSLVLQAELGNYDATQHGVDYANEFRVVPHQTEELSMAMMQLHSTCSGQSAPVAEMLFLHKVKWVVDYGIEKHKVVGDGGVTYHLGLTPTGIVVLRNETRVGNYLWPRVIKIEHKKERVSLRVRDKSMNESAFAFNAKSKAAAKHLWKCASTQLRFFTSTPVENPMVAHRLMAGVSSAPVRKSKFVLPPKGLSRRIDNPAAGSPHKMRDANDNCPNVASPRDNNNKTNNDEGNEDKVEEEEQKIRASSPTSIVDGRRQKSLGGSPHKNNGGPRRDSGDYSGGEGGGAGATQTLAAATGGLFTAAGGSPLSTRSSLSSRYHHRRPQSESEYSHKMGHPNHRSRKSAARPPDADEECAGSEVRHRKSKSRGSRHSRAEGESGSETGSRGKSRKNRDGRRHKHRHGQEVMVDSGLQWEKVQQQQRQKHRRGEGDKDDLNSRNKENEASKVEPTDGADPVIETSPNCQNPANAVQKKYRTRSKSPKTSKGALPPEIVQHIHHDLLDPRGYSDEQLRDIPFTNVETQQRPRRISPHARAGRTALNAAIFNDRNESNDAAQLTSRRRHPGDGAEMQTAAAPVYRSPKSAGAAVVKTASVVPAASKTLGQLKEEMEQQQMRKKDWRAQMMEQQQRQNQRGEVGAVAATGGGAFYFPNGIPSGYFSDATCNDVWADDEMEADM